DAVAGGDDVERRVVTVEQREHVVERVAVLFALAAAGHHRLGEALAVGGLERDFGCGADAFDLAGHRRRFRHVTIDRVKRELQARRARIENEDGFHGFRASRLRWAINCTTAHEAVRVSAVSARLVSTIGTRAPSTTPAISALARY